MPEAFRERFALAGPGQYGMVCGNVAGGIDALQQLGSTPFLHAHMNAPGWVEQGQSRKVKVELAMGYTGDQQIELLGPGIGTQFYTDTIPEDGALTLHHICCMQNDLARLQRRFGRYRRFGR